jgi:hypothetical protein
VKSYICIDGFYNLGEKRVGEGGGKEHGGGGPVTSRVVNRKIHNNVMYVILKRFRDANGVLAKRNLNARRRYRGNAFDVSKSKMEWRMG